MTWTRKGAWEGSPALAVEGQIDQVASDLSTLDAAVVKKVLVDAQGDLLVGTADDTPARLAAGVDGALLQYDSTQASGIRQPTLAEVALLGLGGGQAPFRELGGAGVGGSTTDLDFWGAFSSPSGAKDDQSAGTDSGGGYIQYDTSDVLANKAGFHSAAVLRPERGAWFTGRFAPQHDATVAYFFGLASVGYATMGGGGAISAECAGFRYNVNQSDTTIVALTSDGSTLNRHDTEVPWNTDIRTFTVLLLASGARFVVQALDGTVLYDEVIAVNLPPDETDLRGVVAHSTLTTADRSVRIYGARIGEGA